MGYGEPEQVECFWAMWPLLIPAMNVNVGVRTAAALLDQFYEKRRLLIVSTPTARNLLYRLQLGVLQVSRGRATVGGDLHWEGPSHFLKAKARFWASSICCKLQEWALESYLCSNLVLGHNLINIDSPELTQSFPANEVCLSSLISLMTFCPGPAKEQFSAFAEPVQHIPGLNHLFAQKAGWRDEGSPAAFGPQMLPHGNKTSGWFLSTLKFENFSSKCAHLSCVSFVAIKWSNQCLLEKKKTLYKLKGLN